VTTPAAAYDGATEAAAVLEQVNRFALQAVDVRARRPEWPMEASQMAALLDEARTLGVLRQGADEGLGVWETASGVALSTQVLRRLARSNAGCALAVHRASLGQWVVARLGAKTPAGRGVAAVQGRFGLGRVSLARRLAGAALDDDDRAMLADCYGPHEERLLTSDAGFAWVVALVADPQGERLSWAIWPREALSIRVLPHAHGFDELATMAVRPGAPGDGAALSPASDAASDTAPLAEALCLEALGLMAIGLGAAEHGHAMARAYASARSQGGRPIEGHPAVQLLLASSRTATTTVEALIDAAARRPIGSEGLGRILAARAEAHPLLCRASNDDLQVFGGSGYMRDTGAEKIVRDQNHLRVTCGSPPELSLFVAEWERLHG
jgi:acyl-CoA dehydrogenase